MSKKSYEYMERIAEILNEANENGCIVFANYSSGIEKSYMLHCIDDCYLGESGYNGEKFTVELEKDVVQRSVCELNQMELNSLKMKIKKEK